MTSRPEVTVIIPTKALGARASPIRRALESIRRQQDVRPHTLVVVNGCEADPDLVEALRAESTVLVLEARERGIPSALQLGRKAVRSEWFTSLDDDDVILPGGLATRIRALQARPDCSTVITNSMVRCGDEERIDVPDMSRVERAPLGELARRNWLRPGAWLCRSAQIPSNFFDDMPRALECTYLAARFVLNGGVCFLDQPTIAHYIDTPDSESKLKSYKVHVAHALPHILRLPLPADVRRLFARRVSSARHDVADLVLREGDLGAAWRWHLRALRARGGLRYLSFTRRLLLASLARRGG